MNDLLQWRTAARRPMTVALSMLLVSLPAAAQDTGAPSIAGPGVASLLLNLALVICVIGVCGWLFTRGQKRLGQASDALTIIAAQPLGNRERIVIVQVGEEQVLLGVTANAVSHLHTLETPLDVKRQGGVSSPFAERLRQLTVRDKDTQS